MALAPQSPEPDLSGINLQRKREGYTDLLLGSKDGLTVIAGAIDIGPYSDPAKFASRLEISDMQHFNDKSESVLWEVVEKHGLDFSPVSEDADTVTINAGAETDQESPWKKAEGWQVVDPDAPEQTSILARVAASSANSERQKQQELLTTIAAFEARHPEYAQELRTKLAMTNPRKDGEHWLTEVQVKRTNQEPIPTEEELDTIHRIVTAMLGENVMSNFSVRVQQQLVEENELLGKKPDEFWFDVLMKYGD